LPFNTERKAGSGSSQSALSSNEAETGKK